jgi:hypothetical protein
MPSIALLVHSDMVDLIASRIRDEGVDCALSPPNGILIDCDVDASEQMSFFPCISDARAERIVAALLNVSTSYLVDNLLPGFNCALLPTFPNHSVSGGDAVGFHVIYSGPTSMLADQVPGPETVPSLLGPTKGGPWVLFRGSVQTDMVEITPIELEGIELLMEATRLMLTATGY